MAYMKDSTGKRLDSFPIASVVDQRASMGRINSLFRAGYRIVSDLNRPFYGMNGDPYDTGISQMVRKKHIAISDATDLVVGYANWKGGTISTNGPGTNPIYVRTGFGNPADSDYFQATFDRGAITEKMIDVGRLAFTDPIAGSVITAGSPFYLATFTRTDLVTLTGTTTSGSASVTGITGQVGTLYVGQYIVGTGITAGTKITALGTGTLTLSANATASGTVTLSAYGQIPCHAITYDADNDNTRISGAGSTTLTTDQTNNAALLTFTTPNQHVGYGAAVILGRPKKFNSICIMFSENDSIGSGSHDNIPAVSSTTGSYPRLSWPERTFADDGIMMLGCGSARKADYVTPGAFAAHAQRIVAGTTGGIFQTGTNDIANWNGTTITQATLQATFVKDWRKFVGERGLPGWQGTILPRVTATGNFDSDTSQTVNTYESVRVAINGWLRDGAPVDATMTAVAVGTTGATIYRAPYLRWTGTVWATTAGSTTDPNKHPLALGGIFEVANSIETAQDSGKWQRSWEGTGDITSGSVTVSNVVTTGGTFVDGRVISGASGVAVTISTRFTGTKSGTTITLSAAATATGTGVHLAQPLTDDGTHPLNAGHDMIVAWLNRAGTDGKSARSIITGSCTVAA